MMTELKQRNFKRIPEPEEDRLNSLFGKIIADIRKNQNITLLEMSNQSGIKKRDLRKLEKGLYITISFFLVFRLAECLQIKPHSLLQLLEIAKEESDLLPLHEN